MLVTKVEPLTKNKSKVEIDGQFSFALYKGELSRFHIEEGMELPEETYETLRKEVLLKRAKSRALYLLEDMDRTEQGLREKLQKSLYPDDVVEEALDYVRSYGYLDDGRYARNLIESRKSSKSRQEIYALLLKRGIAKETAEEAMADCFGAEDEEETIKKLFKKRSIDPNTASEEEMQKMYGYLSRKGFRYDEIRRVILELQADS